MSVPLRPSDPAYFLLQLGRQEEKETPLFYEHRSRKTVHRDGCYICEDPEFSLMGMPLCYPCEFCGGHVAADDTVCDECGEDNDDA